MSSLPCTAVGTAVRFRAVAICATLALLTGCSGQSVSPTPTFQDAASFARDASSIALPDVHNGWKARAPMPTARLGPVAAAIGTKIYVIGGYGASGVLGINEIYDTVANTWKTGARMPTPRWVAGVAVVKGIAYVIGGNTGGAQTGVVEAYDPAKNAWSTKAPMPTSRDSLSAASDGTFVYAIGGYEGDRLATVERYDTVHDSWSEEAPLLVAKSGSAVDIAQGTIFAAGGLSNGGVTDDNEGYSVKSNVWTTLAPATTLRQASCTATDDGTLYLAGGSDASGNPLGTLSLYHVTKNAWAKGPSMLHPTIGPAGAIVSGSIYCFGGANQGFPTGSTIFYKYVQAYTP